MRSTSSILLLLAMLCLFFVACTQYMQSPQPVQNQASTVDLADLALTAADLSKLGLRSDGSCMTESYQTGEASPLAQYSICNYTISKYNDSVIIELSRFTNANDLNGSYQYSSSHYRSADDIMAENTYGSMSRFSVNTDKDYGANLSTDSNTYYHLWIVKDLYLIHITSKGNADDKTFVARIGAILMDKFAPDQKITSSKSD